MYDICKSLSPLFWRVRKSWIEVELLYCLTLKHVHWKKRLHEPPGFPSCSCSTFFLEWVFVKCLNKFIFTEGVKNRQNPVYVVCVRPLNGNITLVRQYLVAKKWYLVEIKIAKIYHDIFEKQVWSYPNWVYVLLIRQMLWSWMFYNQKINEEICT